MENITVNLDGILTEIRRLKIPLKQLILDIENTRKEKRLKNIPLEKINEICNMRRLIL